MDYQNSKEVFERGFATRFKAASAIGEDVKFQFRVGGLGDYLVHVKDGTCTVTEGFQAETPLVISVNQNDFLDIANGKESIQYLFLVGRVRVEGALPEAIKIVKFFSK